jgi:hypothetical protein
MFLPFSRFHRSLLAAAALPACAILSQPTQSYAALTGYQTAVVGDGAYEFYRFNEPAPGVGSPAADSSGNSRTGSYPNGGTGSQLNAGDFAVMFNGTNQDLLAGNTSTFGTSVGTSSYEFVFKTNPGFNTTTIQSLFGVFNAATVPIPNPIAITVDLNTGANGSSSANSTRIFIRDNVGDSVGAAISNAALYNGGYHHLVFTFDASGVGANAFKGYVDGAPQTLTFQGITNDPGDADSDPDSFVTLNFNPAYGARNVAGAVVNLANVTVDEASIYGSVLSPTQVSAHAAVPEPGTVGILGVLGLGLLARRRGHA